MVIYVYANDHISTLLTRQMRQKMVADFEAENPNIKVETQVITWDVLKTLPLGLMIFT